MATSRALASRDRYAENVLRACGRATVAHVCLGLVLAKLLKGREYKQWPLYTYWHSLVHTGLVLPAVLATGNMAGAVQDPSQWLRGGGESLKDVLGAEQLVQTTNIGFQMAITMLSPKKTLTSPALVVHHIITILGCFALLHRRHCAGYGAAFTAFTEFGSTFHNIMSLHGGTTTRLLRVFTDIITRGGGLFLIGSEFPIARARGLPLYLQVWSWFGGLAWFGLNAQWTVQVVRGLVRNGKKLKQ